MKIETKTTLIFTIHSDNPPHDVAIAFIKAAGKAYQSDVHTYSVPMAEGAIDQRTTEIRITDGDEDHLSVMADRIRQAMTMIGVLMSEAE